MKNDTINRLALLAGLAVVLGTGCTTKPNAKDNWQDPFFPVNHEVAPTRAIQERQFAAGAAEDAMLYPSHFDGDALNSLGEQKLRQMLVGRPTGGPLHVYLNFASAATQPASDAATTQPSVDALALGRQSAVMQRLDALGVTPGDVIVTIGLNPASMREADAGVRALQPVTAAAAGGSTAAPGGGGMSSGMPR